MASRTPRIKPVLDKTSGYEVASESMTVEAKVRILEEMGQKDMVQLFKNWQPRVKAGELRKAPLDQRISLLISKEERLMLENTIKSLKVSGERITISQYIRNRAMSNIDIIEWREIALRALMEVTEIKDKQKDLKKAKNTYNLLIEEEDDEAAVATYQKKIYEINQKLNKLVAKKKVRNVRLTGRVTFAEAENLRWRASRLCMTVSDYLRFVLFDLVPDTEGDAHMSYDAKRRFYASIIDCADNGFGPTPSVQGCLQCGNYLEKISVLEERVKQLETFI